MENPGERLAGDYLRYVKRCDFVDFNVYTLESQGEIDVVAVNHSRKEAFVCEVVTHLTTGIQYVKNKRPDTSDRLIKKFQKDIQYGNAAFPGFSIEYMLWSPVVRRSNGKAEYDQFAHLERVRTSIRQSAGVEITLIINQAYADAIETLRNIARNETKEFKSPIMRFLQIEEWTSKNIDRIARREE